MLQTEMANAEYELKYRGRVESVTRRDGIFSVGVAVMPHCPVCKMDTYACEHIEGGHEGIMYFAVSENLDGTKLTEESLFGSYFEFHSKDKIGGNEEPSYVKITPNGGSHQSVVLSTAKT
jgi:hypothetical protein